MNFFEELYNKAINRIENSNFFSEYTVFDLLNSVIFFTIFLFVAIFVFGFIVDYLCRDNYMVDDKWRTNRKKYEAGAGEDIYQKYWLWQRHKKKALIRSLQEMYPDKSIYKKKARNKHTGRDSKVPFRREIFTGK